jgi:hypothetical protein
MKSPNDTIGNQTRDLPACSAVNLATVLRYNTADKHITGTSNFKPACLIIHATSAILEVQPKAFTVQFI